LRLKERTKKEQCLPHRVMRKVHLRDDDDETAQPLCWLVLRLGRRRTTTRNCEDCEQSRMAVKLVGYIPMIPLAVAFTLGSNCRIG